MLDFGCLLCDAAARRRGSSRATRHGHDIFIEMRSSMAAFLSTACLLRHACYFLSRHRPTVFMPPPAPLADDFAAQLQDDAGRHRRRYDTRGSRSHYALSAIWDRYTPLTHWMNLRHEEDSLERYYLRILESSGSRIPAARLSLLST